MEGKKKYFALILFLFLGLMIFTFANPNDDEDLKDVGNKKSEEEITETTKESTKDEDKTLDMYEEKATEDGVIRRNDILDNSNATNSIDDSYNKALSAVILSETTLSNSDVVNSQNLINLVTNIDQKNELNQRLNIVKKTIKAKELVDRLENMVQTSTDKEAMNNSRDYRIESNVVELVNNLENTTIKNELKSRLETLAKVLDDETNPEISGIDNNAFTKKVVKIEVTDDNDVTIKVTLNGEEIDFTETIKEEGTYVISAIDAAFNETTITFTIDKTAPKVTGVEDGKYYRTDVTPIVEEENIQNVTVKFNGQKMTTYTIGDTLTKEGVYQIRVSDKAGNKVGYITFTIDKTAPTATIIKSNNDKSTNQDVIVTIKADEEISMQEDWTKVDDITYQKTYAENGKYAVVITDKAGNENEIKFEVKRIDKIAPTATVIKSNNDKSTNQDVIVTIIANEAIYKPEGWTEVSTNKEHEFTKTYAENGKYAVIITDKAGNETEVKFEVKRIDKVSPIVTVIDPNKYQLEVHSAYVDKGYSAYDAVDKDITNRIKITYQFQAKGTSTWPFVETLDTSKLGTYKVIYTVTDKAGNSAKGTRVVQIVDTTAPLLRINGEKNITLEAGIDTYTELGATVTDNVDETITNLQPELINYSVNGQFIGKVDRVDTSKPGVYKIRYTYKDSSGNVAVDASRTDHSYILRVVTVQDTTSPKLQLNGDKSITLIAGTDEYTELGATVTDNVDETITNLQPELINYSVNGKFIGKVNTIDINKPGTYKVKYTYTDKAGNVGVDISRDDHNYVLRTVIVKDVNNPEIRVKDTSIGEDGVYSKINLELSDDYDLDIALVNDKSYQMNSKNETLSFTDVDNYVEGENTVVLKDKFGNETTFKFILDTTSPEFENANATMETPVKIVVNEEHLKTITIYNKTTNETYNVENGYELTTEGYYTITAIDKAGNSSNRWNLTLDNEAPVITIENVKPNNLYNQDVIVNISDIELQQVYLDGTRKGRVNTLTVIEEGTHTVKAEDRYGHKSEITFTIDKTAPIATISYNTKNPAKSVVVTLTTNEDVEIINSGTWNPKEGYATSFKKVYTFNTNQTVTIRDKAGNENQVGVVINNIDRTAPIAIVTVSDEVRSDNGKWVTFVFDEKIDESTLPQGMTKVQAQENTYKKVYYRSGNLKVKDLAGNEAIIPFSLN